MGTGTRYQGVGADAASGAGLTRTGSGIEKSRIGGRKGLLGVLVIGSRELCCIRGVTRGVSVAPPVLAHVTAHADRAVGVLRPGRVTVFLLAPL